MVFGTAFRRAASAAAPSAEAVKRKNLILSGSLVAGVASVYFFTMRRMELDSVQELGEDFFTAGGAAAQDDEKKTMK